MTMDEKLDLILVRLEAIERLLQPVREKDRLVMEWFGGRDAFDHEDYFREVGRPFSENEWRAVKRLAKTAGYRYTVSSDGTGYYILEGR